MALILRYFTEFVVVKQLGGLPLFRPYQYDLRNYSVIIWQSKL